MPEEYEQHLENIPKADTGNRLNSLRELVDGLKKQHYGNDPHKCAQEYESIINDSSYLDIHRAHALYYQQNLKAIEQGVRKPKNEHEKARLQEYQKVLENRFRNHLFYILVASSISEQAKIVQEHIQHAQSWGVLSQEDVKNIFQNAPEKGSLENITTIFSEGDNSPSPQESLRQLEAAQKAYQGRVGECAPIDRQGKKMDSWNEVAENMGASLEKSLLALRMVEAEILEKTRNGLMEKRETMSLEVFQKRMLFLAKVQHQFLNREFTSHFQIMENLYRFENNKYNSKEAQDIEELLGGEKAEPEFDEQYYQRHFPEIQKEKPSFLTKLLGSSEKKEGEEKLKKVIQEQSESASQSMKEKAGDISEVLRHLESGLSPSILQNILAFLEPYLHKTEDITRGGFQKLLKSQLDDIPVLSFFSESLSSFIIQHPERAGELLKDIYHNFDYENLQKFQHFSSAIQNGEIEVLLKSGKKEEAGDLLNDFFVSGEKFIADYGAFLQKLSVNLNDKEASARAWDWFQNALLIGTGLGIGALWASKKIVEKTGKLAGKGIWKLGALTLSSQGIAFLVLSLFPRSAGEGSELSDEHKAPLPQKNLESLK
ncbi:hypothetical protein IPN35_06400 [Candidatus Peregrinibacteria bacterium]|nr:MAG: hypothetical protein IPN35_06400 [Candidatus Peregrinibacteria bacterium]